MTKTVRAALVVAAALLLGAAALVAFGGFGADLKGWSPTVVGLALGGAAAVTLTRLP